MMVALTLSSSMSTTQDDSSRLVGGSGRWRIHKMGRTEASRRLIPFTRSQTKEHQLRSGTIIDQSQVCLQSNTLQSILAHPFSSAISPNRLNSAFPTPVERCFSETTRSSRYNPGFPVQVEKLKKSVGENRNRIRCGQSGKRTLLKSDGEGDEQREMAMTVFSGVSSSATRQWA